MARTATIRKAEMAWAMHTGWTRAEFHALTELSIARCNDAVPKRDG